MIDMRVAKAFWTADEPEIMVDRIRLGIASGMSTPHDIEMHENTNTHVGFRSRDSEIVRWQSKSRGPR